MPPKPFKYLLNISKGSECSRLIQIFGENNLGKSNVIKVESPSRALGYLNKIGITSEIIPVLIFLSTEEMSYPSLKDFLDLLDRDYRKASCGRVVILNENLRLNEYVNLAICDSVLQILNCPVLPEEVETIFRSFTQLRAV